MKRTSVFILILLLFFFFNLFPGPANRIDIQGRIGLYKYHKGHHYFININENNVWRFEKNSKLINKIGKHGEGPGELIGLFNFTFRSNEIILYSAGKAAFFKLKGTFVNEIKKPKASLFLENGKTVYFERRPMQQDGHHVTLYRVVYGDEQFKELSEILNVSVKKVAGFHFDAILPAIKVKYDMDKGCFYVSDSLSGDWVTIYDLSGKQVGKITGEKETNTKVDEEYKNNFFNDILSDPRFHNNPKMAEMVKQQTYFPEFFPPFHSFYLDGAGNIFIKTYKRKNGDALFIKYSAIGKRIKTYWLPDKGIKIADAENFTSFSAAHYYYIFENEDGDYEISRTGLK